MAPLAAALALLLPLFVFACGAEDPERPPATTAETELEITVWPEGKGGASKSWTLTCDPPGGSHPDPASACVALAANRDLLEPLGPDVVCTQIFGGPEEALVTGRFDGKPVNVRYNRRNGCEIDRWGRLKAVLEPSS